MKPMYVAMVTLVSSLFFSWALQAQQPPSQRAASIAPYTLAISYNKTSNLIFPYDIQSVDRGSAAVMAQKARGVNNILQIKASKEGFAQTNLSVVTADGQFYSFLLDYASEPSILNMVFVADSSGHPPLAALSDQPVHTDQLQATAQAVMQAAPFLHRRTTEQKMTLALRSIFLRRKTMWFCVRLTNHSLIDYTPETIRFFIRDKKKGKRTAVQEKELQPLYAVPYPTVYGHHTDGLAFAFTPFTIPEDQELVIHTDEKGAARSLRLRVRHRLVLKARRLE